MNIVESEKDKNIINAVSLIISVMGITVIIWGSVRSIINFVILEYTSIIGKNICKKRDYLRHHFGSYILLGLEFLIAADIIHTVIKPDVQSLVVLGSIVAIRTVISYFLNKEVEGTHKCAETI